MSRGDKREFQIIVDTGEETKELITAIIYIDTRPLSIVHDDLREETAEKVYNKGSSQPVCRKFIIEFVWICRLGALFRVGASNAGWNLEISIRGSSRARTSANEDSSQIKSPSISLLM